MDQAPAIWADGEVGNGRSDPPVARREHTGQDGCGMFTVALALDVTEPPVGAFGLDDTFMPVRWKI